jgi:hypothetical protein
MSTSFTPAPWLVEMFSDESQIHVSSEDDTQKLHYKKKFFGSALTDEEKSNAYLIAAAPEMYALLDEVSDGLLEAGGFGNCELAKRIEALLAKARGEQ